MAAKRKKAVRGRAARQRAAGVADRGSGRTGGLAAELAEFAKQTAGARNWGHPGMAAVLKGISVDEAARKPAPDAHSIWEEVNHIIYWAEDVLMQLENRGVPRPQAWPAAEGGAAQWKRDVTRAARVHAALVRRVAAMSPTALNRKSQKTRYSNAQLILGGISHTAYHTGRIAMLKRVYQRVHQPAGPTV
ncbi:MAG: DinB family protein [bacterium]|nr:DinB family protein [bacterium]